MRVYFYDNDDDYFDDELEVAEYDDDIDLCCCGYGIDEEEY